MSDKYGISNSAYIVFPTVALAHATAYKYATPRTLVIGDRQLAVVHPAETVHQNLVLNACVDFKIPIEQIEVSDVRDARQMRKLLVMPRETFDLISEQLFKSPDQRDSVIREQGLGYYIRALLGLEVDVEGADSDDIAGPCYGCGLDFEVTYRKALYLGSREKPIFIGFFCYKCEPLAFGEQFGRDLATVRARLQKVKGNK